MSFFSNNLTLRDGHTIIFQIINSDEFYTKVEGKKVKNWFYGVEYFTGDNFSIFAKSGDEIYFHFEKYKDFEAFFEETSSMGRHVLKYRFHFDKNILNNKESIINEFLLKINLSNIDVEKLNKDVLIKVQTAVNKNESKSRLYNDNFCAIFLLIGETINQELKSNWRLDFDLKSDVYEPVIIYNSKKLEHFTLLYELIYIEDDSVPILETYETNIDIIKSLYQ